VVKNDIKIMEKTSLEKITNNGVIQKLQESVLSVIMAEQLIGFERAYLVASAAGELKKLLSDEYMKPIMALQGNRLGFKTDKDKTGGYSLEVVKNCLIEAVLMGVQPCGNQFNIIQDNCYLTKEGLGYLLKKIPGLYFDITFELPRVNSAKDGAAITANIEWTINGVKKTKTIEFPVKMNSFMGTDAVIGKATRKARKWLYDTITGSEIPEGDAFDPETPTRKLVEAAKDVESERILLMIGDAKNLTELEALKSHVTEITADAYNEKLNSLS
jgi:hypothetical protein